jgi:[ribosomal protein S18]-alanine N-acetyltransferase
VIRPATVEDLSNLQKIENECFPCSSWKAEHFLRYDCLVAEVAGDVIGLLVSVETYTGDAKERSEREILNLAVSESFRRNGVGSALLQAELNRPAASFFLEVRASNTSAYTLYRRFGFAEIARRPLYYDNPREDAIVMQRKRW